jgi:microcystin-dependent protein
MAEVGGSESVTLNSNQLPAHTHPLNAVAAAGNQRAPIGNILAAEAAGQTAVYSNAPANTTLRPDSIAPSGGNQPHENLPPYLALNFCIALEGIFPPRS